MKRLAPSESGPKFRAQIRHYHRTNTTSGEGSWDQWVDGGRSGNLGNRLAIAKRVSIVLAVLVALGALIVGFINIA
ncbi:MAG: hypothetical protein CFE26_08215 [Verrucomicrobiales bacterium VVV1]|nr:MAG: hypothetical protein CFE26_08215 [Verrucomicrobiales bacterium VVV1]